MMPTGEMTGFSLRAIVGENLIQDVPYPVVAPRSIETLELIVQFARIENTRILPLGMGSSFDHDFQLTNVKIIAVLSGGLTGIHKLSAYGFRVMSGTPLTRLFRGDAMHARKTLGGLIAGASGIHDDDERTLWSRLMSVEIMNGEGKLLRFAGPSSAAAGDPGLAQLLFGSQGRLGMITSVDLRGPLPLEVSANEPRPGSAVLSPDEAVMKRSDVARIFDPNSLFAW